MAKKTASPAPGEPRPITVKVNGVAHTHSVEPRLLLVHFIRDLVGLTGTHVGCDTSNCGACTVIFNGKAVKSCTMFAVQADGGSVRTIEGLAQGGQLHPIQQAFWDHHGLQCGFCTPGIIMQAYWFLQENPDPTTEQVKAGLSGNLCRCTGYLNIVKSVKAAAREMKKA